MRAKLDRWNDACDEIGAARILAENENSTEARACRRHYPLVIAEMLVGKDFSMATRRTLLTETTNDRSNDWLYAYSLPGNMASPLKLIPDIEALGLGIPVPIPGQPYLESWSIQSDLAAPYIIEGTTLYTNAEGATLEHTINDLTGIITSPLVDRAIALELAARIAVPVKRSIELKREKQAEARVAWDEALADDRNRQPVNDYGHTSMLEQAREGYGW